MLDPGFQSRERTVPGRAMPSLSNNLTSKTNILNIIVYSFFSISLFSFVCIILFYAGVGYTWDSNYYLLFSQLIRLNYDFTLIDGLYAPLYPSVLALLTSAGATTEAAIVYVHTTSILVIFLSAARILTPSPVPLAAPLAATYAAFVAIGSLPFQMVWTEVPYAALITLSVAIVVDACRREGVPSLWRFLPLAALPFMRFIGLLPMAFLASLLFLKILGIRGFSPRSVGRILAGGIIASGPIVLFGAVSAYVWGYPFGQRSSSKTSFLENVHLTEITLFDDAYLYAGSLLMLALSIVVRTINPYKRNIPPRYEGSPKDIFLYFTDKINFMIPLSIFLVGIIGQIYSSSTVMIDPINTRYYAPYYPVLVTGLISLALHIVGIGRKFGYVLLAGLFILNAFTIFVTYSTANESIDYTTTNNLPDRFGYKKTEFYKDLQTELSGLIKSDPDNMYSVFFPREGPYTDRGAFLVINSAYYPSKYACRVRSIKRSGDWDSHVTMKCTSDDGDRRLKAAILGEIRDLPKKTKLLLVVNDGRPDHNAILSDLLDRLGFTIVADSGRIVMLQR